MERKRFIKLLLRRIISLEFGATSRQWGKVAADTTRFKIFRYGYHWKSDAKNTREI
ncbi:MULTISPECIES: hypothetical protein [unclassified Lacrimispora]|uniref:hypothetical protein n=1 Tax=unclassified Lacrimispora TaxID=2719232 RepID=UPI00377039E4